jgi:ABC-type uncharacterized transport system permease subunit
MFDPNVPSFFLIILCGFGTVWGFRKASGIKNSLGEFEYLAFSTLWGSAIFMPIAYFLDKAKLLPSLTVFPFLATPWLFLIGLLFGGLSSLIIKWLRLKFENSTKI